MKFAEPTESPVYCVNIYSQAATKNTGYYRPCCHYRRPVLDDHGQPMHISQYSPKEYLNSTRVKQMREDIENGKPVPGCEHCYDLEKKNVQSMRQRHNREQAAIVELTQKTKTGQPYELYMLDLRLGNLCNLGCIMCSPDASSFLNREWKKHGIRNFSDTMALLDESQESFPVESWHKGEKFFNEIMASSHHLKKLWLLGGEPLFNPQAIKILKNLAHRGKDLEVEISSNITVLDEDILSLLEGFNTFLKCSVDGLYDVGEYIRYPSKFETVEKNIDRIFQSKLTLEIVCAVSIFNIFHLKDFYLWLKNRCARYDKGCCFSVSNLVHFPEHMAIANLPSHLKDKALQDIEFILEDMRSSDTGHMPEITFHDLKNFLIHSQGDFSKIRDKWHLIENLDRVRNKSWRSIAPWMSPYLETESVHEIS